MTRDFIAHRFVVHGRVQGVGFRYATAAEATRLGLAGWVRNREDGEVEGEVQGIDAAILDQFRRWLSQGPPTAQVEKIEWTPIDPSAEPDRFVIRHR